MNVMEFLVLVCCLRWFCRLAEKPYESTDANFTLWFLGATWAICAFPMANFLAQPPTKNCNPAAAGITNPDPYFCVCGPFDPATTNMKYHSISNFIAKEATWVYDVGIY